MKKGQTRKKKKASKSRTNAEKINDVAVLQSSIWLASERNCITLRLLFHRFRRTWTIISKLKLLVVTTVGISSVFSELNRLLDNGLSNVHVCDRKHGLNVIVARKRSTNVHARFVMYKTVPPPHLSSVHYSTIICNSN